MTSSRWQSRGPQAPTTLLWHDYETTGLDKARDRPMQFAGIRTDLNLNVIGDPVSLFCKFAPDTVPDPGACLLTGYGTFLNLAPLEFGQVVGLYIATLFVVWQVVTYFTFGTLPTLPILAGGALIVAGGLVVSFWRPD